MPSEAGMNRLAGHRYEFVLRNVQPTGASKPFPGSAHPQIPEDHAGARTGTHQGPHCVCSTYRTDYCSTRCSGARFNNTDALPANCCRSSNCDSHRNVVAAAIVKPLLSMSKMICVVTPHPAVRRVACRGVRLQSTEITPVLMRQLRCAGSCHVCGFTHPPLGTASGIFDRYLKLFLFFVSGSIFGFELATFPDLSFWHDWSAEDCNVWLRVYICCRSAFDTSLRWFFAAMNIMAIAVLLVLYHCPTSPEPMMSSDIWHHQPFQQGDQAL